MTAVPAVSVVIATHDRAAWLAEAVASVRAQTFSDWELIVVDDGSTDGTGAFLAALDEPRLRVLRREHSGNPARVRNAGLAMARGTHVALLDDDDRWAPDKLASQLPALRQSGCRWSHTAFRRLDEAMRAEVATRAQPGPRSGWILEALLRFETAIALPTVIAQRALLAEVAGFDETFRRYEDYELWFRLAARSAVHVTADVLADVRVREPAAGTPDAALMHATWARAFRKVARDPAARPCAALARRRCVDHLVFAARADVLNGDGRRARARLREAAPWGWRHAGWWRRLVAQLAGR